MRFRFSLRMVFILTALAAALCGWLALPTLKADRFVQAIEQQEFAAADRMLTRHDDWFLSELAKKLSKLEIPPNREYKTVFQVQAGLYDWSWGQLLTGRRQVSISKDEVRSGEDWGARVTVEDRVATVTLFGISTSAPKDPIPDGH